MATDEERPGAGERQGPGTDGGRPPTAPPAQRAGEARGCPGSSVPRPSGPGGGARPVDLRKPAAGSPPLGDAGPALPVSLSEPPAATPAPTPAAPAAAAALPGEPAAAPVTPPRRRRRRVALGLVKITAALLVVAVAALMLPAGWLSAPAWNAVAMVAGSAPPGEREARRSVLLTADGGQFAQFYRENRREVPLAEIAPVMRDAMIAAEDERFYDHGPLDTKGILRALVTNARGGVRQGASTITQQYVKNLAIARADGDPDKLAEATAPTMDRKIREFRQALEVERRYTKDEILERYLNVTYFGAGAYGVEAAARRYFDTTAAELTLPQAAMIAGLAKSPTGDAPTTDPRAARERRNIVLTRMVEAGMLDPAEYERVSARPLGLDLTPTPYGCTDSPYPFFCDYVVGELRANPALGRSPEERIGRLLDGGLRVRTTLDPKVQEAAQRAVRRNIGAGHRIGAAIAVVEPGSGAVRAISLNRRWGEGAGATQLNYALDRAQGGSAGFQAGSTFKPFVLAAAFSKGIKPGLELDAPAKVTVAGFRKCNPDRHEDPHFNPYKVGNYGKEDFGRIDMREATVRSVNTYFIQLEKRTGVCKPPRIAERLGLVRADGGKLDRYPSFVLGAQEVSPLRMAEAYATFAAGGVHCPSYGVAAIVAANGQKVGSPQPRCGRVMREKVAEQVTGLLKAVIDGPNDRRTGKKMSLGRPAAGKTGTTNDARAVWFAGYTKDLAAAVWAGYPARSRPLKDVTIKGKKYEVLYGGALPGPIWRDAMKAAHAGEPERRLP